MRKSGGLSQIALSTGQWTVSGNWNTAGTNSIFDYGTSTVIMNGTSKTIVMLSNQQFYTLEIAGTISISSTFALKAKFMTIDASKKLTMTTKNTITFNMLNVYGTIAYGTSLNVTLFFVSRSYENGYMTITKFTTWSPNSTYTWTHTVDSLSGIISFRIGGSTPPGTFTVDWSGTDITGPLAPDGYINYTTPSTNEPTMKVTVSH